MDKREDTGNYYPGGTVVTGTPVPAPGASVNVVSPDASAKAGDAADAKATYEALDKKADKAELHPCTVETTDSKIIITPTKQDVVGGGFYSDEAIKSQADKVLGWEGICYVTAVFGGEYYTVSVQVNLSTNKNCRIYVDSFDNQILEMTETVTVYDDFFGQIGWLNKGIRSLVGYGKDLPSSINAYTPTIFTFDDSKGYLHNTDSYVELNSTTFASGEDKNFVVDLFTKPHDKFFDFTVRVNSANANTADVSWRGLSGMIEKFPGASRMIPGTNVWRITNTGNGVALIDRNTASADGVLTSPSGKKAEIVLNDDMSLEVKEI